MDSPSPSFSVDAVLEIVSPSTSRTALIFASPHSGRDYPDSFLAQSALDPVSLRRSEDSYVDELFAAAPRHGAPLLKALFPRAYLDVNREPYELDPAMFDGPLPPHANTRSPRVAAGLGTIPRQVAQDTPIYRGKLSLADMDQRLKFLYAPYHDALTRLIDGTLARFGYCLLIDCHSMPSTSVPSDHGPVDIVLGDCFGASCAPSLTAGIERFLAGLGYRVIRNHPYAGGYTTRHYGFPVRGVHALQIEINRALYMDEATHRRSAGFSRLETHMNALIAFLAGLPALDFRP